MFEWLVKKIICGKLNNLLDVNKDNIGKIRNILNLWIQRIEKVLGCFKSMLAKLEDNVIDTGEVQQTVDEVTKLIKEW